MSIEITWNDECTWVSDSNENRCSVEYFGSKEKAEKALRSLKNCYRCTNCTNCYRCSDCYHCVNCAHCTDCTYCTYCTNCKDCYRCSDCYHCVNCAHCTDCTYCTYCMNCKNCTYCMKQTGQNAAGTGAPPIPTIQNIDSAVYAAASKESALDMVYWHKTDHCGTTHCRAGWVTHLAGEAGRVLEYFYGTALAAMLIYRESGAPINPARFYDSDSEALLDMRQRAEATQGVTP